SLNFGVIVNFIPENGDEIMAQVKEVLADIDAYTLISFRDAPDVVLDETTVAQLEEGNPALVITSYPESNAEGLYREYKWRICDLYKEETTALAKSRIEQAFGPDCFVYTQHDSSCVYASIPTFEEYISTSGNGVWVYTIVKGNPADEADTLEVIKKLFADVVIRISICYVDDSIRISELNEETARLDIFIKENYIVDFIVHKMDLNTYSRCEYERRK
ncbi:MAG: hypothetical protein IIY94_06605, partial [Oscillospiraceae bacterium]|nr:hypothetical protein [Oscillospiraceae bacterium]